MNRRPLQLPEPARRWLPAIAATAYIALPVRGWGIFDGAPLGPLEVAVVALIWWLWFAERRLSGTRTLVALFVAKALLGGLLLQDRGFAARYYANDAWAPPLEQSLERHPDDVTRYDVRLAFGGPDQPDLPLHFFNDQQRFNFYRPSEPRRDSLPYSVVWEGFIRGSGQSTQFYLDGAPGIRGELAIDGRTIAALDGASGAAVASPALSPDWHQVVVRISAPYGSGRRIEAGEIAGGLRQPFDARNVAVAPVSAARLGVDAATRWITRGVDSVLLLFLAVAVLASIRDAWLARSVGRLLWLGVLVEALIHVLPYAGRVTILSGGDDWFRYEYLARTIALGDPLLSQPGTPGQGTAFHYQLLYPYFVALVHLVTGDDLFGPLLVQRLLLAATVGWVTAITTRLFGARSGWIALVAGGLFVYAKGGRWSLMLMGETWFMPLLALWTWLLIRLATEEPTVRRSLWAGFVGGLATLTRSTLFIAWPIAVPAWSAVLRLRRISTTAWMVGALVATASLTPARNAIVTRAFVPIPTAAGGEVFVGNKPPVELASRPADRVRIYRWLKLPEGPIDVIEYAIQYPGTFATQLGLKAIYVMGFFKLGGHAGFLSGELSILYVVVFAAALAGICRIPRASPPGTRLLCALPALVALSHFIAMVMFQPWQYGDRLFLPMYPLLVPYAALAFEPVMSWIQRDVPRCAGLVLLSLIVLVFLPPFPRSTDLQVALILAAVVLAAADPIRRVDRHSWLYVGYAASVIIVAFQQSGGVGFRRALLLPLAVFAVVRLAREGVTRQATTAALVVAAFAAPQIQAALISNGIWWVAIAAMAAVLGSRAWSTWSRTAVVVTGWIAATLVCVALVAADTNIRNQLADIARDLRNLSSSPSARAELKEDVGDLLQIGSVQQSLDGVTTASAYVRGRFDNVVNMVGIVGALCLLAAWCRILLLMGLQAYSQRSQPLSAAWAILFATVVVALPVAVLGVWDESDRTLLAVAVCFGVAEAVAARPVTEKAAQAVVQLASNPTT